MLTRRRFGAGRERLGGRVRGPLYDIPILLKDNVAIEDVMLPMAHPGIRTSSGFATIDDCAAGAKAYRQRAAPTRPAWNVHQRGPEMTKPQARRETAARSAKLAIGRFVVAARLGNGIDGRRVRRG
jgi:hypothetical protein